MTGTDLLIQSRITWQRVVSWQVQIVVCAAVIWLWYGTDDYRDGWFVWGGWMAAVIWKELIWADRKARGVDR